MLGKGWRLVCLAPLLGLMAPIAGACVQAGALERYEVEDLWIFSIDKSSRSHEFRASVADPGGYLYEVVPGSHIGTHGGRVTRIAACRIYFTELKADGTGGWVEVKRSLRFSVPLMYQQSSSCKGGTRRIETDVSPRAPDAVPPEVTKALADAGLSGSVLFDKIDRGQFVVWTAYPKGADDYCWSPRAPGVDKLVIFHKKSHAVDIVSDR